MTLRSVTPAVATPAPTTDHRRGQTVLSLWMLAGVIGVGFAVGRIAAPAVHDRMWPWVVGRGMGIAAYAGLTALTASGLWSRHPLRQRAGLGNPATWLHVHVALAATTLAVTCVHFVVLAIDSYAGVGWWGTFVPGGSTYRPLAVGMGTVALYVALLVGLTAALAGRLFRRYWRPLHYLAPLSFALVCAHGILAGSDSTALRPVYVATGVFVGLLLVSRFGLRSGGVEQPRVRRAP